MRAIDILLFALCINAAVVFVDASGMGAMFTGQVGSETGFITPESGGIYDAKIDDLSSNIGNTEPSFADMFLVGATWFVENTLLLIRFLLSAVFIVPAMMRMFQFPLYLSVFIQGLLYTCYMWAIIQWRSGKSLFSYQ